MKRTRGGGEGGGSSRASPRAFVKAFHGDAFLRGGEVAQTCALACFIGGHRMQGKNEPGAKASAPEVFRAVPQVNQ